MNNKYKLDIKKIHEAITSGERFGLEEIYHQLTDRGYSWDNNDNVKEIEALISLYDFVYFCETSYDNYFSNNTLSNIYLWKKKYIKMTLETKF